MFNNFLDAAGGASTPTGQSIQYKAPPTPPPLPITITATVAGFPSLSVQATITIAPLPTPPITVTLSDSSGVRQPLPSYSVNSSVLLVATVMNDIANAGVDWTVTCGGAGPCGTLSSAHTPSNTAVLNGELGYLAPNAGVTYTAPATVPSGAVTITASSTTYSAASASATFNITPPNANGPNSFLAGQFAFLVTGRDANYDTFTPNAGGYYALGGTLLGDGQGNILDGEADTMDFKLGEPKDFGISGTYTMAPDGRGQLVLVDVGQLGVRQSYGETLTFRVAFIDSNHALLSESDAFGSGTGVLYRQNLVDVATAVSPAGLPLNGAYTLTLSGADSDNPTQRFFLGGALNATPVAGGAGQSTETSFVGDVADAGNVQADASAKTQPVIGSTFDTFGRVSLGSLDLGASVFHLGSSTLEPLNAYMIDRNHYILIQDVDTYLTLGGYLTAQPASPTLTGAYAFTETGATASAAPLVAGGVFSCGSTGALDALLLGGTAATNQAINASCTAPSNGRGLIAFSGAGSTSSGIKQFAAYPTLDMGVQLVEIDDGGPSGLGAALPQQTTAFSAATFKGNYASNLLISNATGMEGLVGQIGSDGVFRAVRLG